MMGPHSQVKTLAMGRAVNWDVRSICLFFSFSPVEAYAGRAAARSPREHPPGHPSSEAKCCFFPHFFLIFFSFWMCSCQWTEKSIMGIRLFYLPKVA